MDAISIRNVSKSFSGQGRTVDVLRNVSLSVKKGEIFALLGPNGAGKTTLINMLLGLLDHDSGEIRIFGRDVEKSLPFINFVATDTREHWGVGIKTMLEGYGGLYGLSKELLRKRIGKLLAEFKITDLATRAWFNLSTGEQSKVKLARALINNPKLLLLDEPTAGLDVPSALSVHRKLLEINKRGVTIFMASHNMHEVEKMAGRIAFIRDGKILDVSTVKRIKKRYGTLEKYFVKLVKKYGMV